jgi:hypothetical protein
MTNTIAIWLGGFILVAVVGDIMLFGDQHIVYLGKKLADLIEWIAFWR